MGVIGAEATERKKSDFRQPSTRHNVMKKIMPGKDRRESGVL